MPQINVSKIRENKQIKPQKRVEVYLQSNQYCNSVVLIDCINFELYQLSTVCFSIQLRLIITYNIMRAKTLHLFTRILANSYTKIHQKVMHNIGQSIKNKNHFRKVFLGVGMAFSLNYVYAIQDQTIRNLKYTMGKEINALRAQYGQTTVYPQIKYQLRGNQYEIMFPIDQRKCDLFGLISTFMNTYNADKSFRVVDMKAFSNKDGQTTFYVDFEQNDPKFKTPQKGRLTIMGIMRDDAPTFRVIFNKDALITQKNVKALSNLYKQSVKPKKANVNINQPAQGFKSDQKGNKKKGSGNETIKKLTQLGLTVFDPLQKTIELDWDCLAGYAQQKRLIEDTVLLALNYPQVYDEITQQTRVKYEPNRPKAILFEGPPGTGKTTSAKIIAQQVNIPLIYIPTEAIMSKFYGESQTKLASMWQLCQQLGKVIIFIDQIDALAGNRSNSDMHEASRRILSTLLRKIDSFQSSTNVLLICATNRKMDLDLAMLSRIDLSVTFSLPDKQSRVQIFKRYAKHLNQKDLTKLASETQQFSGRNISDICKNAQRRWASKLIRKQTTEKLPPLEEYLQALKNRREHQLA